MEKQENYASDFSRAETRHNALRVLFLEPQPCIRALKYAIALKRELGKDVSLWLGHFGHPLSSLYGFGEEYFDKISVLNPERLGKSVRKVISECKPQIIHSHNAPDTLTYRVIREAEEIPLIHDIHEVLSVHHSGFSKYDDEEKLAKYRKEERFVCENSDGRIYATKSMKQYITERYNVDGENDFVFYNYASESMMPRSFRKKLSSNDNQLHIVYVGCLTSVVKNSHYDLREIFKRIAEQKLHIHLYPTANEITESNETYKRIAEHNQFIHYHKPLGYKNLLHEMTQYDFGWAGLNRAKNRKHLDLAIQNKIFDYISSGLPIISFQHKAIKRFIEENGVGLIINNVGELSKALKNVDKDKLKERVVKTRQKFTFENHIDDLLEFYARVMEFECN